MVWLLGVRIVWCFERRRLVETHMSIDYAGGEQKERRCEEHFDTRVVFLDSWLCFLELREGQIKKIVMRMPGNAQVSTRGGNMETLKNTVLGSTYKEMKEVRVTKGV